MSKIQIERQLFIDMCQYIILKKRDEDRDEKMIEKLISKLDAISKRDSFTNYKTASTPEERELARKIYIEKAEISKDYISDTEYIR